jgi:C1A family cysteine protease
MEFICNALVSPEDKRDYIFVGTTGDLPAILDYRTDLRPIRNQGSQGTCYAQSAACIKEWHEYRDYGFLGQLSPQFFYNHRKNIYDDNGKNDSGMYSRDVMKLLTTVGICTEHTYPYGKIEDKKDILEAVYNEAKSHLIKAYAKVSGLEKTKRSLYENGPCFITFPVYQYTSEFWKKTETKNKNVGGHAVVLVGYTEEGFIVRNSWGVNWGENGYGIYKYDDWGIHKEIWTIVDEKTPLDKIQEFKLDVDRTLITPIKQCCIIS